MFCLCVRAGYGVCAVVEHVEGTDDVRISLRSHAAHCLACSTMQERKESSE